MTEVVESGPMEALVPVQPASLSVPWRDPHTVPRADLVSYIHSLEQACVSQPASADLRTVLGIAHAVNYDVEKSIDALQAAVALDPENFWAQLKYGELYYRLRALTRAEALTLVAMDVATNAFQLALARKQLQQIRQASRGSVRNLSWKMPVLGPALAASAAALGIAVFWLLNLNLGH